MYNFMWYTTGLSTGPITLFIVYVNDLPNCLDFSKTKQFADNTIYVSHQNLHELYIILQRGFEVHSKFININERIKYILLVASR